MVIVTDNLDLAIRRKRLGLSQQDIGDMLGGIGFSTVSRFETGLIDSLPPRNRGERRQTREDYEALLDRLEAEAAR